ncbi:MAG: hypothetical protein Ct9H300mP15_30270 [Gemmatimonadota bacterium]|nr:MAG: hypothetical protein Ct9H300mP15_30270 [Gemmatimonadota bacterium]
MLVRGDCSPGLKQVVVTLNRGTDFTDWANVSRIQNDLPCVDRIRSSWATLIPVTGVMGRFFWKLCQVLPPFKVTKPPNPVPAKSNPSCSGFSPELCGPDSLGVYTIDDERPKDSP